MSFIPYMLFYHKSKNKTLSHCAASQQEAVPICEARLTLHELPFSLMQLLPIKHLKLPGIRNEKGLLFERREKNALLRSCF